MNDWRAINALFLTTTILEGLAFGHVNAFSPLFLTELGLSAAEVSAWTGFLYALMAGVAFPLAPFWGVLAERYSRRLVIVRSQRSNGCREGAATPPPPAHSAPQAPYRAAV